MRILRQNFLCVCSPPPVIKNSILGCEDIQEEAVLLVPLCQRYQLLPVGHTVAKGDQSLRGAEDAALWCSHTENGEDVWLFSHPGVVCQRVQDPVTHCCIHAQILELSDESGGRYGVECRAVIHKQHLHTGIPFRWEKVVCRM